MKNFFKVITLSAILSLAFTGCFDPVYWSVMMDVVPEDPTVSGDITAITRYTSTDGKELLICGADGGLRYKDVTQNYHGAWKTYSGLPFSLLSFDYYGSYDFEGHQIVKVVADKDWIYLVTFEYERSSEGRGTPKNAHIYAGKIKSDGSTETAFSEIAYPTGKNASSMFPFYDELSRRHSAFNIFQTNDPKNVNRKAYIRSGSTKHGSAPVYYTLKGKDAPDSLSISTYISGGNLSAAYPDSGTNINGAVYFNNSVKFLTTSGYTTDARLNTSGTAVPATKLYYGSGSTVYCANASGTILGSCSARGNVTALAVCSDALIIGNGDEDDGTGTGGIQKSNLDAGVPTGVVNFGTNADAQITKSYQVLTLLNGDATNGRGLQSEKDSSFYTTICFPGTSAHASASYDSVGMWSYYQGRGNWNRE